MTKNTKYVSDATNFINDILKKKPELREQQRALKKTWWDVGFLDEDELKSESAANVPHSAYAYYTYNK